MVRRPDRDDTPDVLGPVSETPLEAGWALVTNALLGLFFGADYDGVIVIECAWCEDDDVFTDNYDPLDPAWVAAAAAHMFTAHHDRLAER